MIIDSTNLTVGNYFIDNDTLQGRAIAVPFCIIFNQYGALTVNYIWHDNVPDEEKKRIDDIRLKKFKMLLNRFESDGYSHVNIIILKNNSFYKRNSGMIRIYLKESPIEFHLIEHVSN